MVEVGNEEGEAAIDAEQLAQRYRTLVEHSPDGIVVHAKKPDMSGMRMEH